MAQTTPLTVSSSPPQSARARTHRVVQSVRGPSKRRLCMNAFFFSARLACGPNDLSIEATKDAMKWYAWYTYPSRKYSYDKRRNNKMSATPCPQPRVSSPRQGDPRQRSTPRGAGRFGRTKRAHRGGRRSLEGISQGPPQHHRTRHVPQVDIIPRNVMRWWIVGLVVYANSCSPVMFFASLLEAENHRTSRVSQVYSFLLHTRSHSRYESLRVLRSVVIYSCFFVPFKIFFADLNTRFVRRNMGKEAARRAFGATRPLRRAGLLGHRLYLAHASIELHVNREPEVARRVLELGLSQHQGFIAEPEYVLEYVDFLVQVNRYPAYKAIGNLVI